MRKRGIFTLGIWRFFYLTHLPTIENKLRVMIDWGIDMMFGRKEFTRLKSPIESKDIRYPKNDIDKLKKIVPPNLRVFYRIFLISKYLYFYV